MCLIQRLPTKSIDFPIAYTGGIFIGGMPKNFGAQRLETAKPSPSFQTSTQQYHPRRRK